MLFGFMMELGNCLVYLDNVCCVEMFSKEFFVVVGDINGLLKFL